MVFDAESFVNRCQSAATEDDVVAAVREVVSVAIGDGPAIDAALRTEFRRAGDTLFSSEVLTVQRILWPPGFVSAPHEHRMWAVVGVYAGAERNRVYERSPGGLSQCELRTVGEREVFALGADAIHSVESVPRAGWTAGLHVYGGDILTVERSAWGPDGREVSFAANASANRAMFQAMYDLAAERDEGLDDEARYLATVALRRWCERERRYPQPREARRIVAEAWQ